MKIKALQGHYRMFNAYFNERKKNPIIAGGKELSVGYDVSFDWLYQNLSREEQAHFFEFLDKCYKISKKPSGNYRVQQIFHRIDQCCQVGLGDDDLTSKTIDCLITGKYYSNFIADANKKSNLTESIPESGSEVIRAEKEKREKILNKQIEKPMQKTNHTNESEIKNLTERNLAIVFDKNQCSKKPAYHRSYRDKNGKLLKMRIVMLPSELYRPDNTDFGIDSHGIDRNERLAYLNVPWDMIKHDKNNENKRFFYLNRDSYNIQFCGRVLDDGSIEKIDCVNVTAQELERLFNWSRKKENAKTIQNRLKNSEKSSSKDIQIRKKKGNGL